MLRFIEILDRIREAGGDNIFMRMTHNIGVCIVFLSYILRLKFFLIKVTDDTLIISYLLLPELIRKYFLHPTIFLSIISIPN